MKGFGFFLGLWLGLLAAPRAVQAGETKRQLVFPEVQVVDQEGQARNLRDDLIGEHTLAIQFIFTSCPTVCPPMGAHFGALQKQLNAQGFSKVRLLSISIDPETDTPERLRAWRTRFDGGPGWDLVRGTKRDIDQVLKQLQVFSADINAHTPFVLLGNQAQGWVYLNGLSPAESIIAELRSMQPPATKVSPPASQTAVEATPAQAQQPQSAATYFPETLLTDQLGRQHRLYSDLMADRIIVVHSFFATCTGVCAATIPTMNHIAKNLGPRLGKDVVILSITVDPETDTPEQLAAFARKVNAPPGWYFLTGPKQDVDQVLKKFGHFAEVPEGHSNQFILGNLKTGLWKKAFGLAPVDQILPIVLSVVDDRGEPAP